MISWFGLLCAKLRSFVTLDCFWVRQKGAEAERSENVQISVRTSTLDERWTGRFSTVSAGVMRMVAWEF